MLEHVSPSKRFNVTLITYISETANTKTLKTQVAHVGL
jgi:hypothetical protein